MEYKENNTYIFDKPHLINLRSIIRLILLKIEAPFYRLLLDFFRPQENKETEYNVCICAIFKDEAKFLKEWIEYNKIIGIDHLFLYNNFSSDQYKEVLAPYISSNYIDLIEWPYKGGQLTAYEDCFRKNRNRCKWIGFIDIDEFVVPVKNDDIYDFLRPFEKNRCSVLIYWKLFGTSGKIKRNTNNLLVEDMIICWNKYDEVGKCFVNTRYDLVTDSSKEAFFPHFAWMQYKSIKLPPVNPANRICLRRNANPCCKEGFPIQINHYFTKTYMEYIEKRKRGYALDVESPYNDEYFFRHEMNCNTADYKIYKYLIKLKLAMRVFE